MLDLYDELKAVLSVLERAEVAYAFCGGLALAVYGLFGPPSRAHHGNQVRRAEG